MSYSIKYDIVIYAVPFEERYGGSVVLYSLADELLKLGLIVGIACFGGTYVPVSNFPVEANSDNVGKNTVVVYPEIVEGNPLGAARIVRWILCKVGIHRKASLIKTWGQNDLVFHYSSFNLGSSNQKLEYLTVLSFDKRFSEIVANKTISKRSGSCVMVRKGHLFHGKTLPSIHPDDAVLLDDDLTLDLLLIEFRKYEYMYCYDPYTFHMIYAALSGCVPIIVPIKGVSKEDWVKSLYAGPFLHEQNRLTLAGVAWGLEEVPHAAATLSQVAGEQSKILAATHCTIKNFASIVSSINEGKNSSMDLPTVGSVFNFTWAGNFIAEMEMLQDENVCHLRSVVLERDRHIALLTRNVSSKHDEVRKLSEIVQSAKDWQKRSLFKRIFHRWRPPHDSPQRVHLFKRLERSIRKRRKKILQRKAIAVPKPARTKAELVSFAKNIQILKFGNPKVSVIIPVYGQIDYTLNCLKAISEHPPKVEFEVIVINDYSSDSSKSILEHVEGIHLINNAKNLGFIRSSNLGAHTAKGEYIYFLNNDTQVTQGWMDELIRTFQRFPGTGLAGSKLVYPDGKLQEAGGIIWQDGSAWNFGRNKDPKLPLYNYAREVDYCSGASIMVPRELFFSMGGFDEHYLPAYCEDSDLALKIRDKGLRVIYQPLSEVVHFEGVSSGTDTSTGVKAYQVENMKKVYERWKHRLANHQPNAVDVDNAKDRMATKRVLFLDQCTPTPDMDSGSIDSFNTMILLRDMGFQVTFIPVSNFSFERKYTAALQGHGIEVLYRPYVSSLEEHLGEHGNRYDLVIGCRHNTLKSHYGILRKYCLKAKIVFHTVDLHFLRMQREADLKQSKKHHDAARKAEAAELKLIDLCDRTTVVSHVEHEVLSKLNRGPKVRVMPYSRHLRGSRMPFEKRADLVFIGGFQHHPNIDAVQYFVREVMPLLRPKVPGVVLHVVGSRVPPEIAALQAADVVIRGFVEDLEPLLDQMRVSIAPLRYGAGIKGKIGTAMTVGLPVVATTMAAEGMSLTHGENILVADNPEQLATAVAELYLNEELWNRISSNGLIQAEQEWGTASAWRILQGILIEFDIKIPEPAYPILLYSERSLGNG